MSGSDCSYIDKMCTHAVTKDGSPHSDETIRDVIYGNFQKVSSSIRCDEAGCDEYVRDHLWFCLSCGLIFCGEDRQKHTNQHFQATNQQHSVFVNMKQFMIWCYQCNSYVEAQRNGAAPSLAALFSDQRRFKKWSKELAPPGATSAIIPTDGAANGPHQRVGTASVQSLLCDLHGTARVIPERHAEVPLQNVASTCYLNAVLQSLAHSPWVAKYFVALLPYLLLQPLSLCCRFRTLQSNVGGLQSYICTNNTPGALNGIATDVGAGTGASGTAKLYLKHLLCQQLTQTLFALQIPHNGINGGLNQSNVSPEHQQALNVSGLYYALQAVDATYLGGTQQDANEFQTRILEVLSEILTLKFGGIHVGHGHNVVADNNISSTMTTPGGVHQNDEKTAALAMSPLKNVQLSQGSGIDAYSYIPLSKSEFYKDFVSHIFQGTKAIIEDIQCQHCGFSRHVRREETFLDIHLCLNDTIQSSLDQHAKNNNVQTDEIVCEGCKHKINKQTSQFITKLPLMLVLTFPDKSTQDNITIDKNIDLSCLIEPGSASERFKHYMKNYQVDPGTGERLALQALALHFARAAVASIQRRYCKSLTEKRRIQIGVMVEALALASYAPGLNEVLDGFIRDQKKAHAASPTGANQLGTQHSPGHWNARQKAQFLFQILNSDYKRVMMDKDAHQSHALRDRLIQKQQKQSAQRPPYDLEAFSAGPSEFELLSAVYHTGEDRSGHYTATCNLGTVWKNFADSKVNQTEELSKAPGPAPYMLYYQRQPSALQASVSAVAFQEMKGKGNVCSGKQTAEPIFELFRLLRDELRRHGCQMMIPSPGTPRVISGEFLYRIQQLPWPGAVPGPIGAVLEVKDPKNAISLTDTQHADDKKGVDPLGAGQFGASLFLGSAPCNGIAMIQNETQVLSFAMSDAAGVYAVQPAMVPPGIQVSGRCGALLDALFGGPILLSGSQGHPETFLVEESWKKDEVDDGVESIEAERELYDQIVSSLLEGEQCYYSGENGFQNHAGSRQALSAISTRFLRHWRTYLFSDSGSAGVYVGVINADLCDSDDPYNRFKLRQGLQKGADYILIPTEACNQLKKFYKVFEIELFADPENDIYDYGVPEQIQEQENEPWEYTDWQEVEHDVEDDVVGVPEITTSLLSPQQFSDINGRNGFGAFQAQNQTNDVEDVKNDGEIMPVNLEPNDSEPVAPKRGRSRKKQ